jgi:hypothetical protein
MMRLFFAIFAAVLGTAASAHAGPCTAQIARVEQQIQAVKTKPLEGPSAPQSVGAQLGHQPTPAKVQRGEQEAKAFAAATLQAARAADQRGDRKACEEFLTRLRNLYDLG